MSVALLLALAVVVALVVVPVLVVAHLATRPPALRVAPVAEDVPIFTTDTRGLT